MHNTFFTICDTCILCCSGSMSIPPKNENVLYTLGLLRKVTNGIQCTTCKETWKANTSANNVRTHYFSNAVDLRHHPHRQSILDAEGKRRGQKRPRSLMDTSDTSSTTTTSSQQSTPSSSPRSNLLNDILMKDLPAHLLHAATMAFTMNSISHRVIDDPYFRAFLLAVANSKGMVNIPNRHQLKANVLKVAKEKEEVSHL